MKNWYIYLTAFVLVSTIGCIDLTKDGRDIKSNLKDHITYLADDDLEGRLTGSEGAIKARKYIIEEFKKIGLTAPDKDTDYTQSFDFTMRKYATDNTLMLVGEKKLDLDDDFYPLAFSSNQSVEAEGVYVKYGIIASELNYNDYSGLNDLKGKIFIIEVSSPDGIHPHSKYLKYHDLSNRIETAKNQGAAGIIFVNTKPNAEDPKKKLSIKINPVDIPVVFVSNDTLVSSLKTSKIELSVEIEKEEVTGYNAFGFLDNGAPYTVIIGAHYDHLGYGLENSLYTGNDTLVHNGADDNASGVAMVIELARYIKAADSIDNYNYLFTAFSGEELGLYGSNHFVDNAPISLDSINYMLNMDMVGRLDSSNVLLINGVGSSPAFANLDSLPISGLSTTTTQSGIGPSDHTPFYLEDVPVVHFFTGTHGDYHKPSDDEEFINYDGMEKTFNYITTFISKLDNQSKLEFTPTKENDNGNAPEFSVTLGVIPDYVYDGEGMRIDGIRSGRTADKAGLKNGDIVIKMGPVTVNDMMSYMKALSYFKKGDTTSVVIKRNSDTLNYKVIF